MEQIGSVFDVSKVTIHRWVHEVKDSGEYGEIATLPLHRAATDRLQSMVGKALNVYENTLQIGVAHPKGLDAARDVLKTFRIVRDKIEIEQADFGDAADDELISEAERIVSGVKRSVGKDNAGTEEA